MKEPRLELAKVLNAEVKEIFKAREKCQIIHASADIATAGDEVEKTVRRVLSIKLPNSCHLGHGHVVDYHGNASPQFDIILSDGASLPSLFKAENSTEYFAYETFYCVGEIKTTYRRDQHYFEDFIEKCRKLGQLQRQKVDHRENKYRNPLLKFMLFVDSGISKRTI